MPRKRRKWKFPLWLRVLLVASISFSAMFGLFVAISVSRLSNTLNNNHDEQGKTSRKNLIILAHGRSGSSITGDLFNHHPDVFYMYEPLQTVERTQHKFTEDYKSIAQRFLKNVLRCNFDDQIFLEDIEWY